MLPKTHNEMINKYTTTFIKKLKSILQLSVNFNPGIIRCNITTYQLSACSWYWSVYNFNNFLIIILWRYLQNIKISFGNNFLSHFYHTKYICIMGTTMVIYMAPWYAFLSWVTLKWTFFKTKSLINPSLRFRISNNIYIWKHSIKEL
jgi:hypothetical protein